MIKETEKFVPAEQFFADLECKYLILFIFVFAFFSFFPKLISMDFRLSP